MCFDFFLKTITPKLLKFYFYAHKQGWFSSVNQDNMAIVRCVIGHMTYNTYIKIYSKISWWYATLIKGCWSADQWRQPDQIGTGPETGSFHFDHTIGMSRHTLLVCLHILFKQPMQNSQAEFPLQALFKNKPRKLLIDSSSIAVQQSDSLYNI